MCHCNFVSKEQNLVPRLVEVNKDVVYPMSVHQRLDHLLSGYMRLNYNKSHDKHFPTDITAICISYTGITKHDQYELIKSNTELF